MSSTRNALRFANFTGFLITVLAGTPRTREAVTETGTNNMTAALLDKISHHLSNAAKLARLVVLFEGFHRFRILPQAGTDTVTIAGNSTMIIL